MIPFAEAVAVVCVSVLALVAGFSAHPTSRDFVRKNAEGIKIALLISAALYTAWVYDREATDNRIASTLAFKERAETGELRRAFQRIDMLWIRSDATRELERHRLRVANTSDITEANNLHNKFAEFAGALVESHYLQDEIFAIHGFYKDINVCVKQGRCHEPTACELFAEDLQNFRAIYVEFLVKWEELWDTGVIRSLRGFCNRCREHLPPGEGHCSRPKAPTNLFSKMGLSP